MGPRRYAFHIENIVDDTQPSQAFGLICSSSSNSVWDGKLAYVPALEDVLVWDVKKGVMVRSYLVFYLCENVISHTTI